MYNKINMYNDSDLPLFVFLVSADEVEATGGGSSISISSELKEIRK